MEPLREAYKVGDHVVPKIGPHAGQVHRVIHVHDTGHLNITPVRPGKNRYHLGAAKASPNDVTKSAPGQFESAQTMDESMVQESSWMVIDHEGKRWEVLAKDRTDAMKQAVSVGGLHPKGVPMTQWHKVRVERKNLEEESTQLNEISATTAKHVGDKRHSQGLKFYGMADRSTDPLVKKVFLGKAEKLNKKAHNAYGYSYKKAHAKFNKIMKENTLEEGRPIRGDVFSHHQTLIAKKTLRMPDAMLGVMGGPSKEDSRKHLKKDEEARQALKQPAGHKRRSLFNQLYRSQTAGRPGYSTMEESMELDESFMTTYNRNENANRHTENVVHPQGIPMTQWHKVRVEPLEEMELKGINVTSHSHASGKTKVYDPDHIRRDKQKRTSSVQSIKNFMKAIQRVKGKKAPETVKVKKGQQLLPLEESFMSTYNRNENANRHTENVVHLAKHFGTKADQAQAKFFKDELKKHGHNIHHEAAYKLHEKLWPSAVAAHNHAQEPGEAMTPPRRGENFSEAQDFAADAMAAKWSAEARVSQSARTLKAAKPGTPEHKRASDEARVAAKIRSFHREEVALDESILSPGTKVRIPHRGQMKTGKVVRYQPGSLYTGSPAYVVYHGETESAVVPAHKVEKLEESEQLDELSKKTLSSYVQNAVPGLWNASHDRQRLASANNPGSTKRDQKLYKKADQTARHRFSGIQRAAGKLAKEEVELTEAALKSNHGTVDGHSHVVKSSYKQGAFHGTVATSHRDNRYSYTGPEPVSPVEHEKPKSWSHAIKNGTTASAIHKKNPHLDRTQAHAISMHFDQHKNKVRQLSEEVEQIDELKIPKAGFVERGMIGFHPRSIAGRVHQMPHHELKSLHHAYEKNPPQSMNQKQQHRSIKTALRKYGDAQGTHKPLDRSKFIKKDLEESMSPEHLNYTLAKAEHPKEYAADKKEKDKATYYTHADLKVAQAHSAPQLKKARMNWHKHGGKLFREEEHSDTFYTVKTVIHEALRKNLRSQSDIDKFARRGRAAKNLLGLPQSLDKLADAYKKGEKSPAEKVTDTLKENYYPGHSHSDSLARGLHASESVRRKHDVLMKHGYKKVDQSSPGAKQPWSVYDHSKGKDHGSVYFYHDDGDWYHETDVHKQKSGSSADSLHDHLNKVHGTNLKEEWRPAQGLGLPQSLKWPKPIVGAPNGGKTGTDKLDESKTKAPTRAHVTKLYRLNQINPKKYGKEYSKAYAAHADSEEKAADRMWSRGDKYLMGDKD